MNDYIDSFKLNGDIYIDNTNIYDKSVLVDNLEKCWNGISKAKSFSKINF